jgi:hypothetical protein
MTSSQYRGRVERDRRLVAGAAVEQQRGRSFAEQRGYLVHDPRGHADKLVLRRRAGRQLTPGHRLPVEPSQRERHRTLQRCRGR